MTTDNITVQDLRNLLQHAHCQLQDFDFDLYALALAALDAKAARTDALEAQVAAQKDAEDLLRAALNERGVAVERLKAENAALVKERDALRGSSVILYVDPLFLEIARQGKMKHIHCTAYQQPNGDATAPTTAQAPNKAAQEPVALDRQTLDFIGKLKAHYGTSYQILKRGKPPVDCVDMSAHPLIRDAIRMIARIAAPQQAVREPISKEWCMNMARLEGDADITAGISETQQASEQRATCMCSGLGPCEKPGDVSCRKSEQRAAVIPDDCDVRKILLRVEPGDGDGLEVYAKNIGEVEALLFELGERLEDFEIASHPSQSAPVGLTKPTQQMIDAFKKAYKQGSIWTDNITHGLEAALAAHPVTKAASDGVWSDRIDDFSQISPERAKAIALTAETYYGPVIRQAIADALGAPRDEATGIDRRDGVKE